MQNEFVRVMRGFGFFPSDKPLLVAVSGGIDSMVLATLLHENKFCMAVAHCNYQLRDEASDKDEELVEKWCSEREVPFYSRRVDTYERVETSGDSIQIVARKTRYAFFEELMMTHGFAATALAHHANDRVESLLINVLRGTGLRGLQGMPSKRAGIIRPLIGFNKEEVIAYAKEKKVPFRDDASNLETHYQRNWVRLRLLPMLQQKDAAAFLKLQKLCERVENELPNYRIVMAEKLANMKTGNEGWSIATLQNSKNPFTLLKELLGDKGFSSEQVFEVMAIMNSHSGAQVCSETHRVVKDREHFFLFEQTRKEEALAFSCELLDRASIPSLETPRNVALIDASCVGANPRTFNSIGSERSLFEMRRWRPGDRFKPLGMKGWKKLSDFLIDEKIPIPEKEQVSVLTYQGQVVWVVGMRLDDRFKITKNTQNVLKITVDH